MSKDKPPAWGVVSDAPEVGELNVRKPSGRFKAAATYYSGRALKMANWGPPKTGKTRFIGTAKPFPIFVIDYEMGSSPTLVNDFPELCIPTGETEELFGPGLAYINICEVAVADSSTDDIDPIATLYEAEEAMKDLMGVTTGTIAMDSITVPWQQMGAWVEKTATVRTRKTGKMMQTEWGKANARYFNWWMKMLAKKGVTFIANGQTQDAYGDKGKLQAGGVDANPRWQKQTPHFADFVWHFFKGEMRQKPDGSVFQPMIAEFTDSRFVIAGYEEIEYPTYDKIVDFLITKKGLTIQNGVLQVPKVKKEVKKNVK